MEGSFSGVRVGERDIFRDISICSDLYFKCLAYDWRCCGAGNKPGRDKLAMLSVHYVHYVTLRATLLRAE